MSSQQTSVKPANPPAFPRPCSEDRTQGDQVDGCRTVDGQDGMTLRDYMAVHAMNAFLSNVYAMQQLNEEIITSSIAVERRAETINRVLAKRSYMLADAMLARRGA